MRPPFGQSLPKGLLTVAAPGYDWFRYYEKIAPSGKAAMWLLNRLGLRVRIGLLAVLGLSIALVAFAFLGLRAQQETSKQIENERLAMARSIADQMDRSLNHGLNTLAVTGEREAVNLSDGDLRPERHVLEDTYLLAELPTYRLLLLDRDGQVLLTAPDDPGLIGLNLNDQAFVRDTLSSGRPQVSDNVPASLLGQPVIILSVPVRDAQGEIAGLFVQAVDLLESGLSGFLRYGQAGETSYAEIVDGAGTVIASTRPQHLLQPWEHLLIAPSLHTTKQPQAGVYPAVGGPEGADFLAVAPLSAANWEVVVEQKAREALSPIQRARREYSTVGLVVLLIALVLVGITTREVVQPLAELTAAARRIAGEELDSPIVSNRQDEVGQLAQAFEDMRASLVVSRGKMAQRTQELSVLHQTALVGAEARSVDELATRVTELLAAELYPDNVGFLFLDDQREFLHPHPSYHGAALHMAGISVPLGQGITGTVAQTGQPLLIPDVRADPRYIEASAVIRSELCVPVRAGGQVAGVINVEIAQLDAFTQEHLHLVSAVAGHVGIALEKLDLIEEAQRRASELEALRQVSLDITARLEIAGLLEGIVRRAAELLGVSSGCLDLYNSAEEELELVVSHNMGADYTGARLRVGEGLGGRILTTGQPLIVDDYHAWEGRARAYDDIRARAIVGVPLRWQERILGVLQVFDLEYRRPFDEKDVRLLEAFAQQAAVAIENARLFEAAELRAAELEALRQVSLSMTATLELNTVLDAILKGTFQLLAGVQDAHIFLYQDGRLAFGAALWADGRTGQPVAVPRSDGLTYTVARQGQPIIVSDMRTHPLFTSAPHKWRGAIIGLPLKIGERVVGVMNVAFPDPRTFPDSELRVMRMLADKAAIAIENARLHRAVHRRAEESTALLDIAQTVTSTLSLTQILKQIAIRTAQSCQANRCNIFLLDSTGERLEPLMSQFADGHPDLELWHLWRTTTADRLDTVPLFRQVLHQRWPAVLEDVTQTDMLPRKWTEPFGVKKALVVPLVSRDRAIGVMMLDHEDPARSFSQEQIDLAVTIAGQVAVSIESAQLFKAEQIARQRAETLQEVAAALGSTLELEALLDRVLEEMQKVVPCVSATIQSLHDGQLEIIACRGFSDPKQVIGLAFPLAGDNPNRTVITEKKPLVVPDAHAAYTAFQKDPHSHIRSWLGVPLLAKGRAIGMITLDRTEIDAFNQDEADIALTFANHVAIALENARLYQATHHQAITDGLTRLYNARYFYHALEQEMGRSQRYGRFCSLIMLDLDDFKKYNDCYGHQAGDDLLRELAGLMRGVVRQMDVPARYGGEEFAVILPETDGGQAQVLAERLRETIRNHEFVVRDTQRVGRITVSQGVATYPDDAQDVDGLVEAADMALLCAKEEKDRICVSATIQAEESTPSRVTSQDT